MGLQDDFVEVFQPIIVERIDEICLDQVFLYLGSLFPPVPLFQWQVTVFDEPFKGDCSIGDDLIPA
jgi:hypothetical protein